jgi:hypothetical protein
VAAARVQPRLRCIGQQAKPRVARRRRRGPLLLQVLGVGSVRYRSLALVLVVGRSLVLILRQAAEEDGDEQVERHEVARHHQQHVERGRPRADGVFGVGPNVVPVLARHDDEDREHRGADAVVVGARHLGIAGGGRELRAEELHPKQREDEDAEGEEQEEVGEVGHRVEQAREHRLQAPPRARQPEDAQQPTRAENRGVDADLDVEGLDHHLGDAHDDHSTIELVHVVLSRHGARAREQLSDRWSASLGFEPRMGRPQDRRRHPARPA